MAESRSLEEAWLVVRRIWDQMRTEPEHAEGLGHVDESHLRSLFEAIWDAQFEEDRKSVRGTIEELTRLIAEVASDAD